MREVNESFISHKEFDNWILALSNKRLNNVFKVRIDNNTPEYFSICVYSTIENLVLLAPLEIRDCGDNNYDMIYPQIGPIDWKQLDILEEYDEEEILKILTDNPSAKLIDYSGLVEEDYEE